MGETSVKILIQEGVTQGDFLLMVLYRITLISLSEELREADLGILYPFYVDDAALGRSAIWSAHILNMIMETSLDRGYLPETDKLLFISDTQGQ